MNRIARLAQAVADCMGTRTSCQVSKAMMRFLPRYVMIFIPLSGLVATALYSQIPATRTELELGIASYEEGLYPQALEHLHRAVLLNPSSITGHYYLALVSDDICVPTEACEPHTSTAVREYQKVLELYPDHRDALKRLARLNYKIARPEEAEKLYRRAATLDPDDPGALYGVAVVNWQRAYRELMSEKNRLGLKQEKPLIGLSSCWEVRRRILGAVEETIALLNRSHELANDEDIESYLAVSYGLRAEIQCSDRRAYKRDREAKEEWWHRACLTHNRPDDLTNAQSCCWIPPPPRPPPRRGEKCSWVRKQ